MEIKFLKLIKTIAEEGSIAGSSEKLFLTQSALSHQLKDLEIQLGFKVFYRTRNKWELTEEGSVLYKTACTVMDSIGNGLNAIQQIRAGAAGVIKISTECYSFYHGLPMFIQRMKVLYPEIEVDLVLEATHQPVEKVISNEIDIAVVTSKPSGNKDLVSIEIFEDEIFAVMHQENLLNDLEYVAADNFLDVHLIIHSFPLKTVSVYEKFLNPNGIMPVKISAVPLTEVALEMVQANMGITCMPKWALSSFRLSDELKLKKIGSKGLKRKHYLVVRKSDIGKKYVSDFLLNFKEYFQNFG
ncbi:LysR family transcriptional regulator [Chryseobacterium contaminans]|uniref:LysR family transcriptional regulator n=1 Tax=Chryseobacterium contaminans TaxID=1423959 RepID=A0A1M6WHG7_9FLAO|nr:LysR family transcriptional regulator [Chryseobacterium contaminans]OCA78396.1 LysR family transcriptional regulator [Chryseobacterium contaminans]SHK93222.1 LysR family transcriptional regulator, regulator for metE and metH [Chryseobacterium contaminans]